MRSSDHNERQEPLSSWLTKAYHQISYQSCHLVIQASPKAVANHLARRAVERQLQAQGIRLTTFPYAKVVAQAQVYLAEHPELFDQAMERVRASPWHSMMAEREERERERQERKLARELWTMER